MKYSLNTCMLLNPLIPTHFASHIYQYGMSLQLIITQCLLTCSFNILFIPGFTSFCDLFTKFIPDKFDPGLFSFNVQ